MLAMRPSGGGPSPVVNLLAAGRPRPLVKHPRGVILSAKERAEHATAPAQSALPTRRAATSPKPVVSLVKRFPAVRNQADRGTCVAFASVAFLEFHLEESSGTAAERHSEQFIYWGCKQDDGMAMAEGTFASTARAVLKARGACLNRTWKYNPHLVPNNESQGPPPAGAKGEAKQFTWTTAKAIAAKNVDRLREQLDAQRPVVLSVKTFPSWDFATTAETGDITMPFPGEASDGGHAICLVGYLLDTTAPGGGRLIFRNSWGKTWATKSQAAAGYGTLPFEYVKKYALEAFA
jgi:C1A family cysteine protease